MKGHHRHTLKRQRRSASVSVRLQSHNGSADCKSSTAMRSQEVNVHALLSAILAAHPVQGKISARHVLDKRCMANQQPIELSVHNAFLHPGAGHTLLQCLPWAKVLSANSLSRHSLLTGACICRHTADIMHIHLSLVSAFLPMLMSHSMVLSHCEVVLRSSAHLGIPGCNADEAEACMQKRRRKSKQQAAHDPTAMPSMSDVSEGMCEPPARGLLLYHQSIPCSLSGL